MSLREHFEKRGDTRCTTCLLPDEIMAELKKEKALNPRISWPIVSKWLREDHGIIINPEPLRRHFVSHDELI